MRYRVLNIWELAKRLGIPMKEIERLVDLNILRPNHYGKVDPEKAFEIIRKNCGPEVLKMIEGMDREKILSR